MNLASLFAAAFITPLTKLTSWTLRQAEGTDKGTAAALSLAPDVNRIAGIVGTVAASEAAPVITQAVSKTGL
jgi:hypothetical protein